MTSDNYLDRRIDSLDLLPESSCCLTNLLPVGLAIGIEHLAETFEAVRFQVEGFLAGVAERDERPASAGARSAVTCMLL